MNFYLLFFTFVLLILHSFFGLFTVSFNLLRFLLVLELITFFITILFILASLIYLNESVQFRSLKKLKFNLPLYFHMLPFFLFLSFLSIVYFIFLYFT